MTSSGMKRGLAVSAVTALAVTGLPFLTVSASANSITEQQATSTTVDLYTLESGVASTKNDGQNTTVHLIAGGGSAVQQVRFEYQKLDLTWETIATVSRSNGAFSTEWAPPASVNNLAVPVRAIGLGSVGTEVGQDTATPFVTSNQEAIDISNAPGSSVGVFDQPYTGGKDLGAVSGTTSDIAADPAISISSPSGTGAATSEDVAGEPSGGTRTFSGPVDFSGYTWDADATNGIVDEAIIYVSDDSDDAETVDLYKQDITTVNATVAKSVVQSGENTTATVTVLDQNGKPIVGAEVFQDDDMNNVGDAAAKYTNSLGKATFTVGGSPTGATHTFYVNTTDVDNYEPGVDFRRQVTVTSYTPTATTLSGSSADGAAFDFQENDGDDIQVTVKDQNGQPMSGQAVTYQWKVTPFDGTTATTYPAASSGASDTDGTIDIPFPTGGIEGTYTLNVYVDKDGNPGQTAGDLSMAPLTVKAGEADLVWADGSKAQAPAGSTKTFNGSLELDDETGLPGRNLAISWTPTGNAVVAAQSAQPANTTRTSDIGATSKTNGSGDFGIALADPATPNADELGGQLQANTTATPDIGNAAETSPVLTVDFLKSAAPDSADDITISVTDLFGVAGADGTPGRPAALDITVKNADQTATLTDFPVSVTVNKGFLSPDAANKNKLTPDPAAAEGGNYGEWSSLGTSRQLTTDDSGDTGIVAAIERDAGFDTSTDVTLTVTVTAGGVTKTQPVTFTSDNPLNPGEVSVELDSFQTVGVLPNAPTSENVFYNVFAKDQFGNLLDGEPVTVNDAGSPAWINGVAGSDEVLSHLKNAGPGAVASSDVATSQTLTGEWTQPTTVWTDGQPLVAGFQEETAGGVDSTKSENKTLTDSAAAINWYVIDFANSVFSIKTSPSEGAIRVGTAVTETLTAIDQKGEPIAGLDVDWFRSGPDTQQDGESKTGNPTNSAGRSSYSFIGTRAGVANISAMVTDGADTATVTDRIRFKNAIVASLSLRNNSKGNDVATITTSPSAGNAVVRLFKVRRDGTKVFAGQKRLTNGTARFVKFDRNKRAFTRYQARVLATTKSFADWTPIRRIR